MTPLSETTILVPQFVGRRLTTAQHIRNMFWTAGPALGISLVIFLLLGLNANGASDISTDDALRVLENEFHITALNLLPLALLVVFTLKKVPPFLAILGSALFAGILACFTQWTVVKAFVAEPGLGPVATGIKAVYSAMATGFVSKTGNPAIDQLFSRGGMASLLTTVWLVLATLSFAAIMEHAGFLARLLQPVVAHAPSRGRLIAAVNGSAIGLKVIAGDQYVADVLPARMFRSEFERRGLAPQVLARRRGLRHRHLGRRPLERLRRLHLRRTRGHHRILLPLLLLQLREPDPRRDLRLPRLQGPTTRRRARTRARLIRRRNDGTARRLQPSRRLISELGPRT
jgi:NhaC family Na+:H+ antiporter